MNSQEFRSLLIAKDFASAQSALDEGFSLETQDMRRKTIVHWALALGDVTIVHWVLDRHPNLDLGVLQPSLLELANRIPDPTIAQRLLEQGESNQLNAFDTGGLTPLMRALQQYPPIPQLCKNMIAQGADVNAQSAGAGDSVLMIALNEGQFGLFPALTAAGADPNLVNSKGQSAAHAAAASTDERLLPAFLTAFPGAELNRPAKSGTPAIMECRTAKQVSLMIAAGAKVNVRSGNSFDAHETLLMKLAKSDPQGQVVGQAIAAGADLEAEDDEGCTAAGHAARRGHMGAMLTIYSAGFDVASALDREGISPYHCLLHYQDQEQLVPTFMMMSSLGIPVDTPCRPGRPEEDKRHPSPLFLALNQGKNMQAQMFMHAGASADHPGPDGVPALHALATWAKVYAHATEGAEQKIAQIQKVSGADASKGEAVERLKTSAAEAVAEFEATFAAIVDQSPQWNAPDLEGRTCLDGVARLDQLDMGLRLVAAGASPVFKDLQGFTALDRAVFSGSVQVLHGWQRQLENAGTPWAPDVALFVLNSPEAGNDRHIFLRGLEALALSPGWKSWVNATDDAGNTPLILAAATGQEDLVRFLLTHQATATVSNAQGETALHHAVIANLHNASGYLRAAGADPHTPTLTGDTALTLAGGDQTPERFRVALHGASPKAAVWDDTPNMPEWVAEAITKTDQFLVKENPTPVRRIRRQP